MTNHDSKKRGRLFFRLLVLALVLAAVGVSVRTGQRPELSLEAKKGMQDFSAAMQQARRTAATMDRVLRKYRSRDSRRWPRKDEA